MMMGTIRVKAAKVQVPVCVGGGTEDHIISTRLLNKTARHYGVDAHVYNGRGHWILEEPGWEQVADDVLTWLTAARIAGA
jgi:alpha-beta hydrolase superfamily lysophospholipase